MATPPSVSNSRIFAVPQLDEDSLKSIPRIASNGGAGGDSTNVFANGLDSNHRSSSNHHGGFTLISDSVPGFGSAAVGNGSSAYGLGVGNSGPPSPSHGSSEANELAFLQQQQAAAVAAAAAQLERDYFYSQMLLQQSPRPILLAVLTSLMEDFPTTLISPIKARLEHFISANSTLKSNMMAMNSLVAASAGMISPAPISGGNPTPSSNRTTAASFVPNTNAAPWTPASQQGGTGVSMANSPYSNTHSPSHSRSTNNGTSTTKGKGKGGKEEQEMCSIHHSKRAMKHLQLNSETGLYECIHGFHCLVDAPKPSTSVVSTSSAAGGFTVVGGDGPSKGENSALEGSDSCIGGRARNGASGSHKAGGGRFIDPVTASGYSGGLQGGGGGGGAGSNGSGGMSTMAAHGRGSGSGASGPRVDGSSPADDELLAYTLELLKSVRDIEEKE